MCVLLPVGILHCLQIASIKAYDLTWPQSYATACAPAQLEQNKIKEKEKSLNM